MHLLSTRPGGHVEDGGQGVVRVQQTSGDIVVPEPTSGELPGFVRQHIEEAITAAGDRITLLPAGAVEAARESLAAASIEVARIPEGVGSIYRQVAGEALGAVRAAQLRALGVEPQRTEAAP